ncbi:eukaryotic translation initiation factor 5A-like [Rutidosis leptorrhynchoides]|uniref:eukaryotic translation initiation factor 5A-like n=1 Tax=Rutidosis leptorrhynchoides TaxID=125765 RepID=UPI003A998BEB
MPLLPKPTLSKLVLSVKVIQVSTIRYGRTPRCHFVALDIFNQEKLEYTVPSSYNCDVPHVICTDYMLHKATDGSVLMLSEDGYTKVDIKLLNCSFLMTQINRGFRKHRELAASVISAMGEEHICAIKDLGMIKGYYHPSLLL